MDDGLEECIQNLEDNIRELKKDGYPEDYHMLVEYRALLMFLIELRWRRQQEKEIIKNMRALGT